jgi:NADP-dependent 3-hydroxy acid dehydrogenase YdfG
MNKKTIWITGASTGIGKSLAIKFAKSGWNVAASARREALLKELNKINKNIYSYPLDVTKIKDVNLLPNQLLKILEKLISVYLEQVCMIQNQKKNSI